LARIRKPTFLPTGVLADLKAGKPDPALEALYFHYGRYLLMSSSASVGLPANLQGLWNEDLKPPWDADFHHDVNLPMNYWPAEVDHLEPSATTRCSCTATAASRRAERGGGKSISGCDGIYFPSVSDAWAQSLQIAGRGGSEGRAPAAWLSQHYWVAI
jgi:alpha-L-fucosidase 2